MLLHCIAVAAQQAQGRPDSGVKYIGSRMGCNDASTATISTLLAAVRPDLLHRHLRVDLHCQGAGAGKRGSWAGGVALGGCWQCFLLGRLLAMLHTYNIYHMISGDVHRPGRLGSRPGWAAVVFVTISWLLSRAPLLRCWCVHVRHSCSLHTLPLAPTDC